MSIAGALESAGQAEQRSRVVLNDAFLTGPRRIRPIAEPEPERTPKSRTWANLIDRAIGDNAPTLWTAAAMIGIFLLLATAATIAFGLAGGLFLIGVAAVLELTTHGISKTAGS